MGSTGKRRDGLLDSRHQSRRRRWPAWLAFACAIFVLFFWALPEIGHKILLSDDYYGLTRTKAFQVEGGDCIEKIKFEPARNEGKFLGLYKYSAFVLKTCTWSSLHSKYNGVRTTIYAQAPHSFMSSMFWIHPEMEVSSYKIIYSKVKNLNGYK